MRRTVTVGLDGSPESIAAAEWGAREAELRGLPLRLVHVTAPGPDPLAQAPLLAAETRQEWAERMPRETAEDLGARHPGTDVVVERHEGHAAEILVSTAADTEVLVLGSRGLSEVGGFMIGSVGLAVAAHAGCPVVLVREPSSPPEGQPAGDEGTAAAPGRCLPVVLGLDTGEAHDAPAGFAFEAAHRRSAALRVVHAWNEPPYIQYGMPPDLALRTRLAAQDAAAVTAALRPWREKYPQVEIVQDSLSGKPAGHLVDASREASLVVVGRRARRTPLGAHLGPVAHAVLHHSSAPVAVVPHD
ncbi:universal stress protein [Streptomyces sp. NPDC048566]|uniref:universal stress protein n=1 Tax=Streptomyces sp. NPDC048566 TaxID=3365569 RepID=UPI003721F7D4